MKANDVLLDYLFDGQMHALRPALHKWLEASRRYAVFLAGNRDKIRKKIRLTHDAATAADLHWELEAAYLFTVTNALPSRMSRMREGSLSARTSA